MKKLLFVATAILLFAPRVMATGKIYAVIMGATQDAKIGESCTVDLDRFENELNTLACNLDLDRVPTIRYDGNQCDRPHMEQGLNKLKSCSRDDIVFFYYTGHGMRANNDKTQWPQMCMNYTDQRNWIPVHEVISTLSALPAHLKLILTDCCNVKDHRVTAKYFKGQPRGASDVSEVNYRNLEKLFIHQNGCIIATGSQIDQASLSNNEYGGFFTLAFWGALEDAAVGDIKPTWKDVSDQVVSYTRYISGNRQTPIFQLPDEAPTPTQTPTQGITSPTSNPTIVGNANVNQNMLGAVSVLLNRDLSPGYRMKLIPDIINNYFTNAYTRVQTVGRDMQTIVDTEDVDTFLRRITLDKKIRQINVVTETKDDTGKCYYLKIHEVRNPHQQ